jgi:hypothetical protein
MVMYDEAVIIIIIMSLITTSLLVGLPILFPDMIPNNIKKHIESYNGDRGTVLTLWNVIIGGNTTNMGILR